jgi:predicted transcriptional regulator
VPKDTSTRGKGEKLTQALTIRVPVDVHEALRTLAFATRTTVNDIVLRSVADYLSETGHREAVEALSDRMREQYRVALDKLADL